VSFETPAIPSNDPATSSSGDDDKATGRGATLPVLRVNVSANEGGTPQAFVSDERAEIESRYRRLELGGKRFAACLRSQGN
jgi:hypothetical protein